VCCVQVGRCGVERGGGRPREGIPELPCESRRAPRAAADWQHGPLSTGEVGRAAYHDPYCSHRRIAASLATGLRPRAAQVVNAMYE